MRMECESIYLEKENIAQLLIEGGANANLVNNAGESPLHLAVEKSNFLSSNFLTK